MDRNLLTPLEKVNQLALTETEKDRMIAFFDMMCAEEKRLESIDTSDVERMVFNIPLKNIFREDVVQKNFTRDELQKGAPESMDGFWQVPRLVD